MNWDEYEPFDPGVDRPLHELSRPEAQAAFDLLMRSKNDRITALRRLALANGVDLDAPDGLQQLNDWFVASVEPHPTQRGRLRNLWYSVVNDIALYLGDRLIQRSGGRLRWEFFTAGKKDASYHRAVIMGFGVPNPRYNVDPDMAVGIYGHRIVSGENEEPDFFVKLVESALAKT